MIIFLRKTFVCQCIKSAKRNNNPSLEMTSMATPSSDSRSGQQGKTMTEIVNPFPSRPNTNVVADALDSNGRLAQSCMHLFHSQSHTYSDGSHQMLSPLPTLPWAHAHLEKTWDTHTPGWTDQIFHHPLFFLLLPEGKMLRHPFYSVSPLQETWL